MVMTFIKRLFQSEDGLSTTTQAMLLGFLSFVCLKANRSLCNDIVDTLQRFAVQIQRGIVDRVA